MLELGRLYRMDCMEGMRQFPDGYFELAIVDPPYGTGAITYMPGERLSAVGGHIDRYEATIATFGAATGIRGNSVLKVEHGRGGSRTIGGFGDHNEAPPPAYFKELFRVSRNQLIFGGNYFFLPPSRGFAVWRKASVPYGFSMAMCEFIWASFPSNAVVFEASAVGRPGERIHPTQKPVKLYGMLLAHYARPGDKVLDTHAGSGSCLIACHRAGHPFVGFEIDKDYHAAATERLEKERRQMALADEERE